MRILSRALFLACASTALIASPLLAQKVGELRLGTSTNSSNAIGRDGTASFAAGSTRLYAFFDYSDASDTEITVEVTAPGGLSVFETSDEYDGDGTASVEISGAGMYGSLAEQLLAFAEAVAGTADDFGKAPVGHSVYRGSLESIANLMRATLTILEAWELEEGAESDLVDLQEALDSIDDLIEEAKDLEDDDDDGREDLANLISDEAEAASSAAEALQDYADDVEDLVIPETDADRGTAYLVQVLIGNNPATDLEFWITDESLPDPTATDRPPPTRSAEDRDRPDRPTLEPRPAATDEQDEDGEATESLEARLDTETNPTARARATSVAETLATEAAAPASEADAAEGAPDAAAGDLLAQAGAEDASAEADALPTWTPEPGAGSEGGGGDATSGLSSGPNVALLGLGIMALAAIALWLRRRV